MKYERKYGTYAPVSDATKALIDGVYQDKETKEREIAYEVAAISEPINPEVHFRGATAINAAYMIRNTIPVEGTNLRSPRVRDFNDDQMEEEIFRGINNGSIRVEIVLVDVQDVKGFDKRKNHELTTRYMYRVVDGKYKGLTFTQGIVTPKNGTPKRRLLIDIANTPFEVLPESWQKSNFDPFEFAYKLVKTHPELTLDEYAAIVHVYWLNANDWAIQYNDPLAVPYCDLVKSEQVKDQDNVIVARTFNEHLTAKEITEETCKAICEIAIEEVNKAINDQNNPTDEDIITA